ncbi:hypothetical protein AALH12_07025 [Streptococcus ferus]|uniref:hypothetical protein n=1 Tax=Streptococcus ferus TaxID=1345 RepID=UPI00351146C0
MIINTTRVQMVLSNKAIPAYSLEAETGMSRSTISKYRKGEVDFEKISLKNIMAIQKWIDDGNYKFSYDYSELIAELESDIAEGLTDDYIYIVRGDYMEAIDCKPVIDYYYRAEDIEEGDFAEKIKVSDVLLEMKKMNNVV